MRCARLLAIGLLAHQVNLWAIQIEKVCFIKGGQVYVANADGSGAIKVSTGDAKKAMPKWSPDGQRIVYLDTEAKPNSLGELVVVDAKGSMLGRYPVSTISADGTRIEGMRFVERIGWMDRFRLFAGGSVNPYSGEFRTIEIGSGKLGGFEGTNFTACARNGLVAYWLPVFPPDTAMRLQVSSHVSPVFTFPDWNALPAVNLELAWDKACKILAFVDTRQPPHLVLVAGGRVRHTAPLPGGAAAGSSIQQAEGGFLIGSDAKLFYDIATSKVIPTHAPLLAARRRVEMLKQRLSETLGASEIDYLGHT